FGYFFWRLKKSNSPVRGETVPSVKRANGYVHPVTITPPKKAQKRETKKGRPKSPKMPCVLVL
ncbi:hypothetical protein, partial [Pseudomonas asplenii]|uniref:hypothetical protein n=1 Tax=Pseudomonas asplenii TaxID=53407 RepID=UPI0019558D74